MKNVQTLALSAALGALALTGAQVWAQPAVGTTAILIQEPKPPMPQPAPSPDQTRPSPDQTQPDSAKSSTFTGVVVRDGDSYSLRDGSGAMLKLDDAAKAQPYEGKQVKVTGRLDTDSKMIHVDSIEGGAA